MDEKREVQRDYVIQLKTYSVGPEPGFGPRGLTSKRELSSPTQLLWSFTQPCPSKAGISYPRIQFLFPLISLLGRTDLHHPEDLQRYSLHPEGVFSLQLLHFKETIKSPMYCCALMFAVSLSLITDSLSPDVACELCMCSTRRLWAGRSLSEGTVDMFLARCIIFTTLLGKILFMQPS